MKPNRVVVLPKIDQSKTNPVGYPGVETQLKRDGYPYSCDGYKQKLCFNCIWLERCEKGGKEDLIRGMIK
ncbi:MAG: hypothetical protein ABIH76_06355 [Candidatus Bathyarchaeota archaeon]